jgi:hypothetical protein
MFSNIAFQTADLKWLLPLAIGTIVLFGCAIAMFTNRSWTLALIAGLAVALIGASVFTKVSVTKEGIIIETAQMSVQVLSDLQTAAKANSEAINRLTSRVNELATITQKLTGNLQLGGQPAGSVLGEISQDTKQIQDNLKINENLLKGVGRNNDAIRRQLERAIKIF